MASHFEMRNRAAATYNAAADTYDSAANTFWERFGRRTVERLQLRPGMRVLDVCAGSGASALPAAEGVGSTGMVVAVDAARSLLSLLERKARARRLDHVHLVAGVWSPDGVAEAAVSLEEEEAERLAAFLVGPTPKREPLTRVLRRRAATYRR